MKWYCVTSSYDNRGRVTAAITDVVDDDEAPEDTIKRTHTKDIYNEWFGNIEDATEYMEDVIKENV